MELKKEQQMLVIIHMLLYSTKSRKCIREAETGVTTNTSQVQMVCLELISFNGLVADSSGKNLCVAIWDFRFHLA